MPVATVADVVMAVQDGRAERGVVPIENSIEGSVDATLDALAGRAPDVTIVGEVVLAVRHALIAAPGLAARRDRGRRLPPAGARAVRRVPARGAAARAGGVVDVDRRGGARRGGRAGEGWAAIGTQRAAQLYGCDVVRDGIEDVDGNATRFVWLAPSGAAPVAAPAKTSLAFSGGGAGEPGWLVRCLSEFAFRGVNLTRIESRPRKDRLGDYVFFVDLEGGTGDPRVTEAVEGLRAHCDQVRVLGSYPAA